MYLLIKRLIVIVELMADKRFTIFIFIFGSYFGLETQMISILVLFAILPTAPSAFILARQFGGNVSLMSSIITIQTLLSVLFIILFLKFFF